MKINVISAPSGDWEGLYLNGKLILEGHSLTWWQVLRELGIEYDDAEADDEWIVERGRLPELLEDVKLNTEE